MPKTIATMRRAFNHLKVLAMTTSLTLGGFSCQTIGHETDHQEKAVLESQKALIRNALDSGKPDAALKSLRDLLAVRPEDDGLQNLMGLAQLALGNHQRAVRHLRLAYEINPEIAIGLNLSSALIEAGDLKAAEALLLKFKQTATKTKYPFPERIAHNMGYVALKAKKLTKAEEWYRAALVENPTYFPSILELGRLYESTRKVSKAISSYRQALDYCSSCIEPVEALVRLYVAQGQNQEALTTLTQYLRNDSVQEADRKRASTLLAKIPGHTVGRGPSYTARPEALVRPVR